jgi:small-conductance mechanosensitive channel
MSTLHKELFDPTTPLGALFFGVVLVVLAWVAARLVRAWSRRLGERSYLFVDPTAVGFVAQLLQVGCFLIAALLYAHLVPALHKLGTALLASASVISLVLGLAAQNTLGHLIAGVALLLYRPFALGDILVVATPTGKEKGTVKAFTLGYTKLVTDDGRWIVVPNSVMISSVIIGSK